MTTSPLTDRILVPAGPHGWTDPSGRFVVEHTADGLYLITDHDRPQIALRRNHLDAAANAVAMLVAQAPLDAAMAPFRPADAFEVVIERHDEPDETGISRFTIHSLGPRLDTGELLGHRAQPFRACLDRQLRLLAEQGLKIRVVEPPTD